MYFANQPAYSGHVYLQQQTSYPQENNRIQEPIRSLLLKVFPEACDDAEQKIVFVSRPIQQPIQQIHPIYMISFHQMIEQLFLRLDTHKLQEIVDVLKFVQDTEHNLGQEEKQYVQLAITWLNNVIKSIQQIIENMDMKQSFQEFNRDYFHLFYESVFLEYSKSSSSSNFSQQLMDKPLTFASVIFLMYSIRRMHEERPHQIDLTNCFVDMVQEQFSAHYIKTFSKERIERISAIMDFGLRCYWSSKVNVKLLKKCQQDSPLFAMIIFDVLDNSFRIGYDSTVEDIYRFQLRNLERLKISAADFELAAEIQEKRSTFQDIEDDREQIKLKEEIAKLKKENEEELDLLGEEEQNVKQLTEKFTQLQAQVNKLKELISQNSKSTASSSSSSSSYSFTGMNYMGQQKQEPYQLEQPIQKPIQKISPWSQPSYGQSPQIAQNTQPFGFNNAPTTSYQNKFSNNNFNGQVRTSAVPFEFKHNKP